MLVRHSLLYLAGRGLPGIINFISLAVFTRLLTTEAYGEYTLVISAVATADALLLQWLRLALLRFLPMEGVARAESLSAVLRIFIAIIGASSLLVLTSAVLLIHDDVARQLILLGVGLFIVQGLFEVTIERERSELSPVRYGVYALLRASLALIVGALLARMGLGATALLVGLITAMAIPMIMFGAPLLWIRTLRTPFNSSLARQILSYGLPLATTATLGVLVNSSDRFMLAAFLDTGVAGEYAVGYDLAKFGIGVLLSVVNLAAYPLVVAALEKDGPSAARKELRNSLSLIALIGLPAAVAMAILAPSIADLMVGDAFVQATTVTLPWIAIAAFIGGFKSFYLDLAFQLGRDTMKQLWIMLATVILNVGLNLWWIPTLGLIGAVYSTVIAYLFAALLAWRLGRKVFILPAPRREVLGIVVAAGLMALGLIMVRDLRGVAGLALQVVTGGLIYVLAIAIFNRDKLKVRFRFRG